MIEIRRRGLMLVLSSPSGAGKTTLSRLLLETDSGIVMSVSATTRPKRPNEIEGRDYFFVTPDAFGRMIAGGEFLEYAGVFDFQYGTPKKPVMEALAAGRDVLFDIDWQGTQQLKERVREDLVSVFILPPSHAELERRLRTRAQDSDEVVSRRMSKAADEISHWPEYDYVIVNDDVGRAHAKIVSILEAERARRARLVGVSEFAAALTR
ncbi:MAG: guanylate kinase [Alphaproteobacteria bacterium]|nr:guanylate kinase [Alphaproteobacteria bacterium]MBV9062228.1 guanylate kinase [Alphaproteobacteria bacterium]